MVTASGVLASGLMGRALPLQRGLHLVVRQSIAADHPAAFGVRSPARSLRRTREGIFCVRAVAAPLRNRPPASRARRSARPRADSRHRSRRRSGLAAAAAAALASDHIQSEPVTCRSWAAATTQRCRQYGRESDPGQLQERAGQRLDQVGRPRRVHRRRPRGRAALRTRSSGTARVHGSDFHFVSTAYAPAGPIRTWSMSRCLRLTWFTTRQPRGRRAPADRQSTARRDRHHRGAGPSHLQDPKRTSCQRP